MELDRKQQILTVLQLSRSATLTIVSAWRCALPAVPHPLLNRVNFFDQKEVDQESFETDFTSTKTDRWWTVDSDEESYHSCPIYEDPLQFSASPSSLSEQDVLVMDSTQTDQFLDIRDKDFFNIAGDEIHGFSKSSCLLDTVESINNSLNEVLDNLSSPQHEKKLFDLS